MDCPQCGWTCGDQDKFCSQCGCKLQPNSEPLKDLKEPSVPQKLKICTLDATSVSLSWEAPPDMEGVLHKYNVSWHTNNQPSQSITTKETFTKVDGLNPACDYFLSVRSVLDCNGLESDPLQTTVRADLPPPGEITVHRVTVDSVSLSWGPPEGLGGHRENYMVSWDFKGKKNHIKVNNGRSVAVPKLSLGREYVFSVVTTGVGNSKSNSASASVITSHEKQNEHGQSQLSERTSSVDEFKGLLKDASEEETANDWTLVDEERCNDQTGDQETETTKLQHVTSDKNAGSRHQNEIEEKGCSEKVASFSNIEESFSDKDTTEEFQDSQETLVNNDEATEENVTGAKKEPTETDDLIVEKITFHSVSLRWRNLTNMQDGNTYTVSWYSSRDKQKLISTTTNTAVISNLNPGTLYTITVKSQNKNGTEYQIWHKTVCTELSQPRKLTVDFVHPTLISLTWRKPHGMDQVPHRFNISYHSSGGKPKFISTKAQEIKLTGLIPGTEYTVSVSTVVENKMQSAAVSKTIFTKPSVPQKLKICTLDATSVSLSWEAPPDMEGVLHKYNVSWHTNNQPSQSIATKETFTKVDGLNPACDYFLSVRSVLDCNGLESDPLQTTVRADLPPPGEITVHRVTVDSVSLSWGPPEGLGGHRENYMVSWDFKGKKNHIKVNNGRSVAVPKLSPGREYVFSVVTTGVGSSKSNSVSASVITEPSPPLNLKAEMVRSRSVTLQWERPKYMDGVSYQYMFTYNCDGEQPKSETHESTINSANFSGLKPGTEYRFTITTVLQGGSRSSECSVLVCTKTCLDEMLSDLGLHRHLKQKLTLSTVLEISSATTTAGCSESLKSLPWHFLRKLMMVNVTARSNMCINKKDSNFQSVDSFWDNLLNEESRKNEINPLDVITAIFLCSDSFLQQEMVLKMSMCQFSVPLLLPNCNTQQCTLMLWAMRDIVKKFRPRSLKDPKGFVENSIVLTQLPLASFVRLGTSSLSKSRILNHVLSNPQQYHDTFIHYNMACGDTPKQISNGLIEISWSLPCGHQNIDIFPEPIAIANLHGDVSSLETQFSFLCQASSALFVFCDDLGTFSEFLHSIKVKGQLFLVTNSQSRSFNLQNFKAHVSKLQLQPKNIIIKTPQMNDAEFVKMLCAAIDDLLKKPTYKISIEEMSNVAHELGIPVDEDFTQCQNGKQMAEKLVEKISDIPNFKQKELPLQGKVWKELTQLEKEECRLKKAGDKSIEIYKSELLKQKQRLREQQRSMKVSDAMTCFMSAMSDSREVRPYFLKWLRINLDNISRKTLSCLRDEYKGKCFNSLENKELISDLDRQISSSSLGVEHFLREMGQLYESASSRSDNQLALQQMKDLPLLCAELLLDGFPLELIDGDASNIPVKWISAVLTELHRVTKCESKIRVITVLGVQSTGKSTLLNTMFGVQFAVSSGRCTRGAFMLLIKVKEDFRKQLGCHYLMVIDTEGLKSPELAQLEESYEHDNELATLVVGLSDVTVINIAMENSTEMKDILQIVVHAFLRMKEVGRKPCCQFVHQNVPDVSAHDKNLRDRKHLLEQLNEMTQTAARMEKRGHNKKFTDIMKYNPEKNNWYIPGLWHGNPPMAPVSVGYSETVDEFKKSLIRSFTEYQSPAHTFMEFLEWTKSLWKAVKYENFIFSFRNSLVADAYSRLCTEFNKWEWAFRKHMYSWLTGAETKVSNFSTAASQSFVYTDDLLNSLKCEGIEELNKQEKIILDKIEEYYKRQEGHVHLVEKYKEDFVNSAKTLRRETENSIKSKTEAAVEIKKGMMRLDSIKKTYTDTMEQKVLKLIERCRKMKSEMSDQLLETEFGKMWDETVRELSFTGLEKKNVVLDIYNQLRANLGTKGSSVHETLTSISNLCECGKEPFKVQSAEKRFFKRVLKKFFGDDQKREAQQMADKIIQQSQEFIAEKVQKKADYHNTYILDLLHTVDQSLENHANLEISVDFEASLKIHVCGHAARKFQQMHENFIRTNDPRRCLEQYKDQYLADFKDLFYQRDQCQKKAKDFADLCLAPAVREYVKKSLGPEIVDEMLTGRSSIDFSTRSFFQFFVLKQLLCDGNFQNYIKYNECYEQFVKDWIFKKITDHFSQDVGRLQKLMEIHQKEIMREMKEAVDTAKNTPTGEGEKSEIICHFIQKICTNLNNKVVIPKDALDKVIALNTADPVQFSQCLLSFMEDMEKTLTAEFKKQWDAEKILKALPFKPQDELFRRVFGCGKQCPFCKTPCEAGGKNHTKHFASIHRPQGIGRYRDVNTDILVTDICSSCVASEMKFRNRKTKGNFHPYKDYQNFYPDWQIQPDTSIEASDYWKFVFTKFNQQFAEEFNAKPAYIPQSWKAITKKQALKSLEETFKMKEQKDAN